MQFHVLSFEGPDAYARVGGLATRVEGLSQALAALGHEAHLWFVGSPDLPGHETRGSLHLHRWCQWVSRHHPGGVYDGDYGKQSEYAASLPPYLVHQVLAPHLRAGERAVVLAEEWQTAHAVLHLHWLLRYAGLRDRVRIFWNANNTFGFDLVPWARLAQAASLTAVSRYMKQCLAERGVEALVIPNGLAPEAFEPPDRSALGRLRGRLRGRTAFAKLARWDPHKRWIESLALLAAMKREGWKPLLIARGGSEPYGREVLRVAAEHGLAVRDRGQSLGPGARGLVEALADVDECDVVNLCRPVDPDARRVLLRGVDAVLANSGHEPFGLVGLETMACGGLACTGCSGEDYAVAGENAIVVQTGDPEEFIGIYGPLRGKREALRSLRRCGRATARRYAWERVVSELLLPRIALARRPPSDLAPWPADRRNGFEPGPRHGA